MARAPIGLRVRERRKALGWTQVGLAERLSVSPSYLNLIENGKRPIGGRILMRLAEVLEVDLETLDAAADRRLIDELSELAGDPVLRELTLDTRETAILVGRHGAWARALSMLHRAYRERDRAARLLADRLSQDPLLSDAVHRMLSNAAAIRSTAEILDGVDDLSPVELSKFHSILGQESGRLAEACEAIVRFFDHASASASASSPAEEVDFFLLERDNYFPRLESAAEELLFAANVEEDRWKSRLIDYLQARFGVTVERAGLEKAGMPGVRNHTRFDHDTRRFYIFDSAPEATRRFEIAKLVAKLGLAPQIEAEISMARTPLSDEAARYVRRALASYCAGAMAMPYEAFFEQARGCRFDIDVLAQRFQASYEQAAHRLVTLRAPNAAAPPFAFMRSDASGFVTKRYPLPNLPLPRQSGACPLWAVYQAFQTPETVQRQLVEFPGGERFLFVARAVTKECAAFERPRRLMSVMIACEAVYADQLVYGDGLDFSPRAAPTNVGPSCQLCMRETCASRQEGRLDLGGSDADGIFG
ncbi:MAG: DUF2083 domain-containing protein [Rhodobacteraceae bacterium]|nr:DUF2083 domain-containing protein [Paracoccaceae bacterium]